MNIVKNPLAVSIVGPSKIGVTSVCTRIKFALENLGYTATVVAPRSLRDVRAFEDSYYSQRFADCDVILFDNHHYTTSAIRTGRRDINFDEPDAIKPDLAFLLIATPDDYVKLAKMRTDYQGQRNARALMDKYQNCNRSFFGAGGLTLVRVDGEDGRLTSAGKIKNIIISNIKKV